MSEFLSNNTDPHAYRLTRQFHCLHEEAPDKAWARVVANGWPGWRKWYLTKGQNQPEKSDPVRAIRRHMPELESTLEKLTAGQDHDVTFLDFLSFWCPPRYLVSCTQFAATDDQGPYLIRNYDLDPALNEAIMLRSNWRGKPVLGMVEGLAGLSDGVNGDGLAVSLSFGGRVASGKGFGVPLIIRYILEICRDVADGVEALRAIPSHMSYNITLTDRNGAVATVFLAPDRPAMVSDNPWATNHQIGVEWPWHARFSQTLEREDLLGSMPPCPASEIKRRFHSPPLFASEYSKGYGTVFTTLYRPLKNSAQISWPNGFELTRNLDDQKPTTIGVTYTSDFNDRSPGGPITMSKFAIAGIQMHITMHDNLPEMERRLSLLMHLYPWVEMVVFSELTANGPNHAKAEPADGPFETRCRELAQKFDVWLMPGSYFQKRDGKIFNTAIVVSPQGEIVSRYDKMFPFTPYEQGVTPGQEVCVFDVPDVGRFGLSICYDMWFPEVTRTLVSMGAEVILNPVLASFIDRHADLAIVQASAAMFQTYVFSINGLLAGGNGYSRVVDPAGHILHDGNVQEELIPIEIDFDLVRRQRRRGIMNMGQPLKSFRDTSAVFPIYQPEYRSEYLDDLGPLEKATRPSRNNVA